MEPESAASKTRMPARWGADCQKLIFMLASILIGCDGAAAMDAGNVSRAEWYRRLQWDTETCTIESPFPESSGVSVQAFGQNASLVTVVCERWAYQGTERIYLLRTGEAQELTFLQFEDAGSESRLRSYRAAELTGVVSVEAENLRIIVLRLYRGIGDCGQYVTYRIKENKAILQQLRLRHCSDRFDANAAKNPQTWPLVHKPPHP